MADNVISGYAARFEDEAVIAGEFREKLAKGCFSRTLKERPDVIMLLSHDVGRVLGRVAAGTLVLREDGNGLWFSLDADPTTPEGQTAIGNARRQDVRGCSFGFRVRDEEWRDGGSRLPLRIIKDLDLFEITLTCDPAYPTTSASLRADQNASAAARRVRMKAEAAI